MPRRSSPRSPRSPTTPRSPSRVFDEVADARGVVASSDPGQPVRDRPRSGRNGARQGDLQQPGPARERARDRPSAAGPSSSRAADRADGRRDRIGEALESLAGETSRRGLLARAGAALLGRHGRRPSSRKVVKPGDAARLHQLLRPHLHDRARASIRSACRGSTRSGYPHPPQRRRPDRQHRPAGERPRACRSTHDGDLLRDPDGLPLPPAPRTKVCKRDRAAYDIEAHPQGSWYRCCGGTVRKLWDCCSHTQTADQRRCRAARLLLRRAQGLLRDLLPDPGPMLSAALGPTWVSAVSVLELTLAGAALLVGLTGAWSPCGFSMIETVGLGGRRGRTLRRRSPPAPRSPGRASLGGVVTFGLARPGAVALHGAERARRLSGRGGDRGGGGGRRGARACGSCRRCAASCRSAGGWTMPLPLAAGLYGILLGLGFTTFVLSFGVWALAGISVALGDPGHRARDRRSHSGSGGRMPVVAVAPIVDTPARRQVHRADGRAAGALSRLSARRCGDPGAGRGGADRTGIATAARTEVANGADPSADRQGAGLPAPGRAGVVRFRGQVYDLPGRDPAVGGPYAAVISAGDRIQILNRYDRSDHRFGLGAERQGARDLTRWLAYLTVDGEALHAASARRMQPPRPILARRSGWPRWRGPAQIGHPSLDGGRVFYAVSRRHRNAIKRRNLKTGKAGTVLRSRLPSS